MKKIKIGRSNILYIAQSKFKCTTEDPIGNFDYGKWVEFIENHKEFFIWYEDTESGINLKNNMDKVPDWAREGILYSLNKTHAYSTNKMTKNPNYIRVVFSKKWYGFDRFREKTKQICFANFAGYGKIFEWKIIP